LWPRKGLREVGAKDQTMTRSYEERVGVNGRLHTITVIQKSKTVWFAVGDYRGERIEVKGTSAKNAAKYWVEAARYRGN
jgi:hypothetical protein